MPLNKPTQTLIDEISALNPTPRYEMEVSEVRRLSDETSKKMGGAPEEVASVEDKFISSPEGKISIRIYTPFKQLSKGALIYFNGSGFIHGSLEKDDVTCRALANGAGCKVIAVKYRSAPEDPCPAGLNDAYHATKWILNHVDEFDIDLKKVAIGGYSSGGNFAALTAIRLRNEGIKLAAQVLICPCLDLSCTLPSHQKYQTGYILDAESIRWFFELYLQHDENRKDPAISPYWESDLSNLPPALVITAEYDPLHDEGCAYAEKLKEAGIDVQYSCYEGQIHALLLFRGRLLEEENPRIEISDYLRELFK